MGVKRLMPLGINGNGRGNSLASLNAPALGTMVSSNMTLTTGLDLSETGFHHLKNGSQNTSMEGKCESRVV